MSFIKEFFHLYGILPVMPEMNGGHSWFRTQRSSREKWNILHKDPRTVRTRALRLITFKLGGKTPESVSSNCSCCNLSGSIPGAEEGVPTVLLGPLRTHIIQANHSNYTSAHAYSINTHRFEKWPHVVSSVKVFSLKSLTSHSQTDLRFMVTYTRTSTWAFKYSSWISVFLSLFFPHTLPLS